MPGEWTLNAQLVMKANVSVIAYPGFEAYDWDTNTVSAEHPHIIPGTCSQCGIRWGTNSASNNEFSGFEVSGGHSGIDIILIMLLLEIIIFIIPTIRAYSWQAPIMYW